MSTKIKQWADVEPGDIVLDVAAAPRWRVTGLESVGGSWLSVVFVDLRTGLPGSVDRIRTDRVEVES